MPALRKAPPKEPRVELLVQATTPGNLGDLLRAGWLDAQDLIRALAGKEITTQEWYFAFGDLLGDIHAGSWRIGRHRAGDRSPGDAFDDLIGRAKLDAETEWLQRFLGDLESGRYLDDAGELREAAVRQRSKLYVLKARSTANEAFVETGDDFEEYDWVLGAVEEHCSDCPELAAMSPWTKGTAVTHPGMGETPCLGNCQCHWVRVSDGLVGFEAISL